MKKSSAGSSGKQEDLNGNGSEVSAREKLLNDQPELLQQFGIDLLPVLVQVSFFWCICLLLVSMLAFFFSFPVAFFVYLVSLILFTCQADLWF